MDGRNLSPGETPWKVYMVTGSGDSRTVVAKSYADAAGRWRCEYPDDEPDSISLVCNDPIIPPEAASV